ncbi:hypothetical protein ACOI9Y_35855, partial [Mesorhizobium japonicum]
IWGEKNLLTQELCIGLFAYLSTPSIDMYVRRFSGHTQINATDLNSLPLPSALELEDFGKTNKGSSTEEIKILAEQHFFPTA